MRVWAGFGDAGWGVEGERSLKSEMDKFYFLRIAFPQQSTLMPCEILVSMVHANSYSPNFTKNSRLGESG